MMNFCNYADGYNVISFGLLVQAIWNYWMAKKCHGMFSVETEWTNFFGK